MATPLPPVGRSTSTPPLSNVGVTHRIGPDLHLENPMDTDQLSDISAVSPVTSIPPLDTREDVTELKINMVGENRESTELQKPLKIVMDDTSETIAENTVDPNTPLIDPEEKTQGKSEEETFLDGSIVPPSYTEEITQNIPENFAKQLGGDDEQSQSMDTTQPAPPNRKRRGDSPDQSLAKIVVKHKEPPIRLSTVHTLQKQETNIPDKYITVLYDYKTSNVLDLMEAIVIFQRDTYFYHGTNMCSALNILKIGFKSKEEIDKLESIGGDFGEGTYFSDNVEKVMSYGNVVFVCKLNMENSFVTTKELEGPIDKYDSVSFVGGKFDRHGKLVENNENNPRSYNEFCVFDTKNIEICYAFKLDTLGAQLDERNVYTCVHSLQDEKYFLNNHTIEPFLTKLYSSELHKTKLFYLRLDTKQMVSIFVPQNQSNEYVIDPSQYTFCYNQPDPLEQYRKGEFEINYVAVEMFLEGQQLLKDINEQDTNKKTIITQIPMANENDVIIESLSAFEFTLNPNSKIRRYIIKPHVFIILEYMGW
jgi:hypothetical protein